ncbi:M20 family metallopeptidase [Paenibacillus chartarius]|uniref:M20 family metallopeptidase n=1 Tax=Paenibacillus chartarius TaxID=747481 RepID=A0ABV6DTC8_9BACL
MNMQRIYADIEMLQEELVRLRRDLHRHPELMYEVRRTAGIVAGLLESWEIEVERNVGAYFGAGVIGTLRGGRPGKTVVLRADMDALPIEEKNDADYRSTVEGAMHACGHDAHTVMLLGSARALSRHREEVPGIVKFVFQPAEEGARPSPGDGVLRSGGADMIEAGILDGADRCFALHVWPELPIGTIGVHRSYVLAASTHFTVAFHGLTGHHATPHLASDAITMAAQWIVEMRTFMSAALNPLEPTVLGFGTLQAGTVRNAIADRSEVTGSFRAFEPSTVERIRQAAVSRAQSVAALYGGTAELSFRIGTALRNDSEAASLALQAGAEVFGGERVMALEQPSLAGEDFALYTKRVPGAMALIGIRNEERGFAYPLHHPQFDLDERVLSYGAKIHAEMVRRFNS